MGKGKGSGLSGTPWGFVFVIISERQAWLDLMMGLIPNNRSRKDMDRNGLGFAGHYTWIGWGNGVEGAIELVFLNSKISINMNWIGESIRYLAFHTLISSQFVHSQCSNELTQPDTISIYYPESPHYLSQLPFVALY